MRRSFLVILVIVSLCTLSIAASAQNDRFEPNDDNETSTPVDSGFQADNLAVGPDSSDDFDIFRIRLVEDETIRVTTSDRDSIVVSKLFYDSDGDSYTSSDISEDYLAFGDPTFEFTADRAGLYYILVEIAKERPNDIQREYSLSITGNAPPEAATAPPPPPIEEGSEVELDGTQSSDPDNEGLLYNWDQVSGPTVELSGSHTPTPEFVAPSVETETTLRFRLTVRDESGATDSTTLPILVLPAQESATTPTQRPTETPTRRSTERPTQRPTETQAPVEESDTNAPNNFDSFLNQFIVSLLSTEALAALSTAVVVVLMVIVWNNGRE